MITTPTTTEHARPRTALRGATLTAALLISLGAASASAHATVVQPGPHAASTVVGR